MKIENKLIPRRLIAGIILLLLSIFEMVESYHVSAYGQMINNDSYNGEGGLGMIIGAIAFIVALVFIFTSKSRPKKWVEITLAVFIVLGVVFNQMITDNTFIDLPFFGWINVVISCFAFPWSKKGYKGMPYISKDEKNEQKSVEPAAQTSSTVADEIVKYKQLADNGIITQEEFEAKKKQLLNI
ncbi:SHOCT domain-containing protein [Liquorilactobacillus mali]|uniref:SHOCT domain-containing protein n=1 Tax=Liquorilactobacillus mali KCTC 3596 = DSM 20444 TaxID=1046596 RepID=J1F2H9_9LACO|nr:SHOCT domain-containing protein [Liquorilactobacillus mali]EJE99197.1 hypothetical protein LMA_06196 [Liquorilactobacillus mali KCTC 3596 = DSM 20444]KRN08706.1 hypothetical protein FD00_GL001945 [Liquorilactobacillus mali KCTC 3596 = DSM 20444]QFQ75176.1 SHOCT domain-containing protein [Liquorilactobacillus mali]